MDDGTILAVTLDCSDVDPWVFIAVARGGDNWLGPDSCFFHINLSTATKDEMS
jgi:hypothetical protein